MKQFVITILVACSTMMSARAQTFTEHLQQEEPQWGKVTIHHSADIDELVNGKSLHITEPQTADSIASEENSASVGRVFRTNGYRVQVLAGGNSRDDKTRVTKAGGEVKATFPDEAVYVSFYSPRWTCRVGNYRTYEEAHQMLVKVQAMGYRQATIIKGKISLKY